MTDNTTQPEVTLDDIELARKLADRARWQVSEHWTKGFAVVIAEHRLSQPPTASTSDVREKIANQCRWCGQRKADHLENEIHPARPICPQEPRKHDYFAHWPADILALASAQPAPVMVEAAAPVPTRGDEELVRLLRQAAYHMEAPSKARFRFGSDYRDALRDYNGLVAQVNVALSRASNEVAPAKIRQTLGEWNISPDDPIKPFPVAPADGGDGA